MEHLITVMADVGLGLTAWRLVVALRRDFAAHSREEAERHSETLGALRNHEERLRVLERAA